MLNQSDAFNDVFADFGADSTLNRTDQELALASMILNPQVNRIRIELLEWLFSFSSKSTALSSIASGDDFAIEIEEIAESGLVIWLEGLSLDQLGKFATSIGFLIDSHRLFELNLNTANQANPCIIEPSDAYGWAADEGESLPEPGWNFYQRAVEVASARKYYLCRFTAEGIGHLAWTRASSNVVKGVKRWEDQGPVRFVNWAFNELLKKQQKEQKRLCYLDDDNLLNDSNRFDKSETSKIEFVDLLERCLTEEERTIIRLKIEGHTNRDIAAVLGKSVTTVRNMYFAAKESSAPLRKVHPALSWVEI